MTVSSTPSSLRTRINSLPLSGVIATAAAVVAVVAAEVAFFVVL